MGDADALDEKLDLLDEAGNPTGVTATRREVHRTSALHRTVHVWIVTRQNEILLQKRSLRKQSHPGCWDVSAAGHVASGDGSLAAAVREVYEELGVRIDADDARFLFTVRQVDENPSLSFFDRELADVYLVRREISEKDLRINPDELDGVRLFSPDEFRELMRGGGEPIVPHLGEYERLLEVLEGAMINGRPCP